MPADDPEARAYTADFVGCLLAYAHLTNSRSLALLGDPDPDADAHEILFYFASPEEKRQFLVLIRANKDLGNDYIENDFMLPTNEEIRNARPQPASASALKMIALRQRFTRFNDFFSPWVGCIAPRCKD